MFEGKIGRKVINGSLLCRTMNKEEPSQRGIQALPPSQGTLVPRLICFMPFHNILPTPLLQPLNAFPFLEIPAIHLEDTLTLNRSRSIQDYEEKKLVKLRKCVRTTFINHMSNEA
jgi:hypothetical protein